jgi:hypothetical protein
LWVRHLWLMGCVLLCAVTLGAQQQYTGVRPKLLNITTATITVVKSSPGTLHTVTVNSSGGSPCNAVVWDSVSSSAPISGTRLAGLDCTSKVQFSYESDTVNGIVVDTTGDQVPADITVSYN